MILPKIEIKKILFATDLSENARQALAYAASLANLYGAGITIVHAREDSPGVDTAIANHVGADRWAEIKKQYEQKARDMIIAKQHEDHPAEREALKSFYKDVAQRFENQSFALDEVVVKRGQPVNVIIETAEKKNCDLIVIGTQGHGKLAQMIVGSTAKKVLKRAKIPVLVIRLSDKL
jgi:nucleotide-binding universal stress UspA family protein